MNHFGGLNIPFCFLIDFEEQKPRIWRLDQPMPDFHFEFNGRTSQPIPTGDTPNSFRFDRTPVPFDDYARMFSITKDHILRGDSYLVNLTAPTKVGTNLRPDEIYRLGRSKYKCQLNDQFVSFSPETFIRINNGRISSHPMKGTIDASIPNAEALILNDQKEAAEHATIVDLIRNDLGRIATHVRVDRYRYYETIEHHKGQLGQVSSEVSGTLPDDFRQRIGDILFALLPAGSSSGAPKKRTVDIIREAEGQPRGYYTGIAGYMEDGKVDSCVLIRYLETDGTYRSGGGITCASTLEAEYLELINKVYVPIH